MDIMQGAVYDAPLFNLSRTITGSPVVAEDDEDLSGYNTRLASHFAGYDQGEGYVILAGGSSPTVRLMPVEVVKDQDGNDTCVQGGFDVGPLQSMQRFSFDAKSSRLFFVLAEVTGSPTSVKIMLAGKRAL